MELEMTQEWEEVARNLLEEKGNPLAPIDAFELARDCGFDVVEGESGRRSMIVGNQIIRIDPDLPGEVQRYEVACCLGRWALYRAGLDSTPEGGEYVGLALMLPPAHFLRELRETLENPIDQPTRARTLLSRASHLIDRGKRRGELAKCRSEPVQPVLHPASATNRGC